MACLYCGVWTAALAPILANTQRAAQFRLKSRYVNGAANFIMFISILFTFASTTVKIYLEFSERELFEKMKGIVAIVSAEFVWILWIFH